MSRLSELIEKFCPNGVEWKELGEVCEILDSKRKPITKKDRIIGEYPYYGANGIQDYVNDYIFDGDFLLVGEDGTVLRNDNSPVLNWATGKIWVNNHAHVLSEKDGTLLRYLYFVLQTIKIAHLIKGTPPKLNQQNLRSIKIPIPPMEIQKEIVHILDSFTNLIENLTTELVARKKQYEFYRNHLLTFGDDVERVKLKDIAVKLFRGNGIKRDDLTSDGTPCVRYGEIYTDYGVYFEKCKSFTNEDNLKNKKYIEYGDILFAITGESVEEIGKSTAYVGNEKVLVGGDILVLKHNQNPKYLSYFLSTEDAIKQKTKGKVKSKVVHTNAESIRNILIPLPSLQEQERIVSILDKFDKLCNDLSEGLPAEIEARKKQYEYYRDKLLTFKNISEIQLYKIMKNKEGI